MEEKSQNSIPTTEKNEVVVETKPAKKSGGCLKGCLIVSVILLFVLVLIAIGGYLGYRKIVKGMEQKDFGITYTEQDYLDLMNDIGIEADPALLCIDCPTPNFSDPKEVSIAVSNERASAAFEYINQHLTVGSVSNTQIRINDGNAELSTTFTYQGKSFPIYMRGDVSKLTESSISGDISELKVGALPVPNSLLTMVEDSLLSIANEKIAAAGDTIRIDTLNLEEGSVIFDGIAPSKVQ
jgi:hypothetical protein